MVEEPEDREHISLRGYIRIHLQTQRCMQNTSSGRTGRPDQRERIQNHPKLGRTKELGGKQECS